MGTDRRTRKGGDLDVQWRQLWKGPAGDDLKRKKDSAKKCLGDGRIRQCLVERRGPLNRSFPPERKRRGRNSTTRHLEKKEGGGKGRVRCVLERSGEAGRSSTDLSVRVVRRGVRGGAAFQTGKKKSSGGKPDRGKVPGGRISRTSERENLSDRRRHSRRHILPIEGR